MAESIKRRTFVKGAALTGATVAVAGLAGCSYKEAADARKNPESVDTYDLVVLGTGGAGLCAAIAAHDDGAKNVVIIEKMPVAGGNTMHSSSGMNASETAAQKKAGIEDTNELFISDTYSGGHNVGEMLLIEYMCDHSNDAIEWLSDHGIVLDNLGKMGGASVKRCHRPTDGSAVGLTLVPGLLKNVDERNIPVLYNRRATKLITSGDAVTGVVVEDEDGETTTFNAKAVVIATGGFGYNRTWIEKYKPEIKDFPSTNTSGSMGDGCAIAEAVGAKLVDMQYIQTHPTVEQTTSTLVAEAIRGAGAIMVNSQAKRFYTEEGTRDMVSNAELEQPGKFSWCVFDQTVFDKYKACSKYKKMGLTKESDTLEGLAKECELDAATFAATVADWNSVVKGEKTDDFGRTPQETVKPIETPTFYAVKIAPGIHHTMGGIHVNTDAQALRSDESVIPGLYAAGEVTGGLHGANRLGGNAVCDIVVNGLHAGKNAAAYIAGK
jgi:fumarate reductase flavoprotein subunit